MLNFSKMHSLGNDFMVIDGVTTSVDSTLNKWLLGATASAALVLTSYCSSRRQARQPVTSTTSSSTPTVAKLSSAATVRGVLQTLFTVLG